MSFRRHWVLFDVVFGFAGAKQPPGDSHFGVIQRELMRRVIKGERDFAETLLGAIGRAVEHHVQHLLAAQAFGGHLAQAPTDGIRNIGFSAAVRSHDRSNPGLKFNPGSFRKRLKTDHLEMLQSHEIKSINSPRGLQEVHYGWGFRG